MIHHGLLLLHHARVRAHASARACVRARVRARVRVCVRARACVRCITCWCRKTLLSRPLQRNPSAQGMYVALSGDGSHVVANSQDKTLRLWDLDDESVTRIDLGYSGCKPAISSDGSRVLSSASEREAKLYDWDTRICVKTFRTPNEVVCLGLSALFVVVSSGKDLCLFSIFTGALIQTLSGHTDTVTVLDLAEDGRTAISGSRDSRCGSGVRGQSFARSGRPYPVCHPLA